jgi:hypothetical protein
MISTIEGSMVLLTPSPSSEWNAREVLLKRWDAPPDESPIANEGGLAPQKEGPDRSPPRATIPTTKGSVVQLPLPLLVDRIYGKEQ